MCIAPNESHRQNHGTPPTVEGVGNLDDSTIEVESPNLPVVHFNFRPMTGDDNDENGDLQDLMQEDTLSTTLNVALSP
jgi:hypothetical protein